MRRVSMLLFMAPVLMGAADSSSDDAATHTFIRADPATVYRLELAPYVTLAGPNQDCGAGSRVSVVIQAGDGQFKVCVPK